MGVVEKVGPGVAHLTQGQRVVGAGWGTGTWAEYITVPATCAVRRTPLQPSPRAHLAISLHQSAIEGARCWWWNICACTPGAGLHFCHMNYKTMSATGSTSVTGILNR